MKQVKNLNLKIVTFFGGFRLQIILEIMNKFTHWMKHLQKWDLGNFKLGCFVMLDLGL